MANVLIIGGGVSGLSAGIYAQMNGHRAVVCERHAIAGGNLTGWRQGDYHIDNCIHWLTGTNPAANGYKMWVDLGALGDVEVFQGASLYTCERDGQRLSLKKDLTELRRDMLSISPADKKEICAFIRAIEAVQGMTGIAGKDHNEKGNVFQMLRAAPALLRYERLSTGALAKRFSHPLIRAFIASFLGEDFNALALVLVSAHFCGENGGIPKGSSCAMAKRMTDRFIGLGGQLLVGKEAKKINVENGVATSVSFADGTELAADYVIVTTDPAVAFGTLLDAKMPRGLAKLYRDPAMQRFSAYHCAFSCDLPVLPFEGDFVMEVPAAQRDLLRTKYVILREFSHEPDFAPADKNLLQTMVFCGEEDARAFIALRKEGDAYRQKKQALADAIGCLISRQFPEMKDKLQCLDVWTPATYQRYTDAEIGSYMGFALPPRALPLRIGNRIKGLSNVLLATQWLQAPGGLPIAAKSGKCAIEAIEKAERRANAPVARPAYVGDALKN